MTNEVTNVQLIPIEQLKPHPNNPRKNIGDIDELTDSIKAFGVLQNLTVTPAEVDGYVILGGHRRCEAARRAGLKELPCAVITEISLTDQIAMMLCENMQRNELTLAEQSQAFQMMIDLGDSVADVCSKTGLSESTVRRRLKLAELDHDKLADACGKNITIDDMLKLNDIENVKVRDSVLAKAGTAEFNLAYKNAIDRQNAKKKMPGLIKELETFATRVDKISFSKYSYAAWLYAKDFNEGDALKVKKREKSAIAWVFSVDNNSQVVSLYYESAAKSTITQAKTPEQKAREADIRKREKQLKQMTKAHYELRCEFIKKANIQKGLTDALLVDVMTTAMVKSIYGYWTVSGAATDEFFGVDKLSKVPEQTGEDRMRNFIGGNRVRVAQLVVQFLGDSEDEGFWSTMYQGYPKHNKNGRLSFIYAFLETLGYQMSAEEKALRSGTHELFNADERN